MRIAIDVEYAMDDAAVLRAVLTSAGWSPDRAAAACQAFVALICVSAVEPPSAEERLEDAVDNIRLILPHAKERVQRFVKRERK